MTFCCRKVTLVVCVGLRRKKERLLGGCSKSLSERMRSDFEELRNKGLIQDCFAH